MHKHVWLAASLVLAAPAAADDWSGFHGGLQVGFGAGGDAVTEINGPRRYFLDTRGPLGGAHVGWQRQLDDVARGLVLGVEVEAGHLGQSGDLTRTDGFGTVTNRAEIGAYAAFSARAGYGFLPGWLVYGRAGLALGEIDVRTTQSCPGGGATCALVPELAKTSDVGWGPVLGVGVEHALDAHWRARVEYMHIGFSRDLVLPSGGVGPGWHHATDVHALKLGVSYRF